ncbi:MAG: PQQ-binding-like beta-propeller repeat protein, partial [Planctomycetota bacterium]
MCVSVQGQDWTQWRGNAQNGVAHRGSYPMHWDGESPSWSLPLPGRGGSTPVTHDGNLYVTYADEDANHVLCLNAADGTKRWDVPVGSEKNAKHSGKSHRKGSSSNPSAVLDDSAVYAYFRSGDLAAISHDGTVLWRVDTQDLFGVDSLWWDLGTSPLLLDDVVVVTVMQTGPSYLAAFDKKSGEVKWKVDRMLQAPSEAAQSYTTPVAIESNGEKLIAVMGADHLTLHNQSDGKERGRLGGFNPSEHQYFRSIASPVATNDVVACPYARGATLTGVSISKLLSGKGESAILWHRDDLG